MALDHLPAVVPLLEPVGGNSAVDVLVAGAQGEGPAVDLAPADVDQPRPIELDEQGEVCPLGARLGGDGVDELPGEQPDCEAELP
jgi:hypothetical protein